VAGKKMTARERDLRKVFGLLELQQKPLLGISFTLRVS
jgi:hypothetical protein